MKQEQWEELLKRFNWDRIDAPQMDFWREPGGESYCHAVPSQDMNTLFEWIVPKLKELNTWMALMQDEGNGHYHAQIGQELAYFTHVDPFEALAQAIYKITTQTTT